MDEVSRDASRSASFGGAMTFDVFTPFQSGRPRWRTDPAVQWNQSPAFVLAGPQASWVAGQNIRVDGGVV
jgi:NAD(P)-dependent dehydrogenase (short-subunit alcohol dehydrogenase family)